MKRANEPIAGDGAPAPAAAALGDSRHARQLARRRLITETVMAEGSIRIEDLADRLAISLMTVHRDLDDLVGRGLVRKSRGLVSAAPTRLMEASDVYRASRDLAEKSAIAAAAMAFVEPGQAIFLDDATTVLQMVPELPASAPLTVITNSLTVMNAVRGLRDIDLIALGGEFHAWCNAFMGNMTTADILRLRADAVFLSMAAIIDGTVFHQSSEVVAIKQAMMAASAKKILLMDHTKFERRALHCLCPLTDFDAVVVDDRVAAERVEALRRDGANVVVAPVRDRVAEPGRRQARR
jgi:DeoR/GlpR family transcriptional regulator of sugar metabolism